MPDFELRVSDGHTVGVWSDPPVGEKPSRINFRETRPQTYILGTVGVELEIRAIVGGVDGPTDAALGGRLFNAWFVESPDYLLELTPVAGSSSIQRFTPTEEGHYTVGFERPDGGIVHVHIDVEAA